MHWKSRTDNDDDDGSDDDDDSSEGDSSDDDNANDNDHNRLHMRGYEWLSHFFEQLVPAYSYVELSDDFEHIRDCHMKLNKSKTSETIAWFDCLLGKCEDKTCPMLARHCRDRHVDNINEVKRRQTFFIHDHDVAQQQQETETQDIKKKKKKVIKKQKTVRENAV